MGENLSPAVALKVLSRLSKFSEVADAGGKKPGKGDADNDNADGNNNNKKDDFLAGTLVWTPGGMSPIEDLKKGDTVFTRSDTDYTDHSNQITQLLRREAERYYEILAGTETIKVTDEHPFWCQGSGWAEAKDLKPGDPIAAAAGDVVVRSSKYIKGPVSVYNFSVEVNHNYFVSPHKLWVHNAGDKPCSCEGRACSIAHDEESKTTDVNGAGVFVNLVSEQRNKYILEGDATGGGHM